MQVTPTMVKELRERTGAPMMECKTALVEANGDLEEAMVLLRKKGMATAARKSGRATAEGIVGSYVHGGGRIGVLVEVNCETDFVARTEEFQELVKDIALHIAASDPRVVKREDVTEEILRREREIYRQQALDTGKPEKVVDRIVDGKMEKFYAEAVLLEQPFVKKPEITVSELIVEKIGKLRENIQVSRFARFKLGEASDRSAEGASG